MIKPESDFGFRENGAFDVDFGEADAKNVFLLSKRSLGTAGTLFRI